MPSCNARAHASRRVVAIIAALNAACSSGNRGGAPSPSPAAIANVQAELRMVGSESTWVSRGDAFEISARSKRELAALLPQLAREDSLFRELFGTPPIFVQIAVARPAPYGDAAITTPVLPRTATPLVTIEFGDALPSPDGGQRSARGGERDGGRDGERGDAPTRVPNELRGASRGQFAAMPLRPVIRAWASARASALNARAATSAQSTGESIDMRVPAWGESALLGLTADSARIDFVSRQLMATDSLYPLAQFFSMSRPPNVFREVAREGGRGEGERRPGGGEGAGGTRGGGGFGGGMGGMGGGGRGRGGMGGMGGGGMGGGGRGGYGRGAGSQRGGERPMMGLAGGALFDAQALVFAHYLAVREGLPFIGQLLDAQMTGKPTTAALASARAIPTELPRLDEEWRRWMAYQVRATTKR